MSFKFNGYWIFVILEFVFRLDLWENMITVTMETPGGGWERSFLKETLKTKRESSTPIDLN